MGSIIDQAKDPLSMSFVSQGTTIKKELSRQLTRIHGEK